MILWTFVYKFLCRHVFTSLGNVPRSVSVESMVTLLKNCQIIFQSGSTSLHSHRWCMGDSNFSKYLSIFVWSIFFITVFLGSVKWYLLMAFICFSLKTNESKKFLICFYSILFGEKSIQTPCPFFSWVITISLLNSENSLYILNISPSTDMTYKYFLQFCGLSFQILDRIIWVTNCFNLDEFQYIYFFFCHCKLM